jgi:AcrR family transcriptional regulator
MIGEYQFSINRSRAYTSGNDDPSSWRWAMPRVSVAHSDEVRARIVAAAAEVVLETGVAQMTIGDVVRASGLSVGAIYTYFPGKDELVAAACEQVMEEELANLAVRLAGAASAREKMHLSVGIWFDELERDGAGGNLLQMWAAAATQPRVREMLVRRRERLMTVARMLLSEAVARGELPVSADHDDLARGFQALLEGSVLQRIEEGDAWRRSRAEHRATVFLDLLFDGPPRSG